ncbi:MAG: glycosyltransferase [Myxococcales bacterium]|nr:glycosyltransferase [Myxococcales bacterium]
MRILWIKIGGLWPVDRGGRRRSFETVRALAERHAVTVATTHVAEDEVAGLRGALPGSEVLSWPWQIPKHGSAGFALALGRSWASELPVDIWRCVVPELRREVAERLRRGACDVCVVDFLAAAPNVSLRSAGPLVLFSHNVEHQIWRRLAKVETRLARRALLEVEWRKMRRYEDRVVGAVARTIAVSEADRAMLASRVPGASVCAVPTGVDLSYFRSEGASEAPGSIVFVGAMDWYPNEDAVLHFAAEILPRVQRAVPDATLTVVGRNPSARLRALGPAVRVTGTVDDVRPHLGAASVVVVPLRVGGGTRLKIFEALAMQKAVVSTAIGAEGLPLRTGEHFVCADEPAAFADAVVALLRDPGRRTALGVAGRGLVETRFGWAAVARAFERELEEVHHARSSLRNGIRR